MCILLCKGTIPKKVFLVFLVVNTLIKDRNFYFCPVSYSTSKLNKYNKSISVQSPIFLTHSNVIENNQIKQKFLIELKYSLDFRNKETAYSKSLINKLIQMIRILNHLNKWLEIRSLIFLYRDHLIVMREFILCVLHIF
jgi:hypothetical protein